MELIVSWTNLSYSLTAQSLGHSLSIVTGRPASQILGHLLEGSLCQAFSGPRHTFFQGSDLIFTSLDKRSYIEFAILESLGACLNR